MMRKLFEAWAKDIFRKPSFGDMFDRDERQPDEYQWVYIQEHLGTWQAACNLFLNHVEILPDDAEPKNSDIILDYDNDPRLVAKSDGVRVYWATEEGYEYCYIGQCKILTRNGKYCIRESEFNNKEGE